MVDRVRSLHRSAVRDLLQRDGAERKFVPSASPTGLPLHTDQRLRDLTQAHVQSFNYMIDQGIDASVADIMPREFRLEEDGRVIRLWVEDAAVAYPSKSDGSADARLFPAECRERQETYQAPLMVTICRCLDEDGPVERYQAKVGDIPIMVGSRRCHLAGLSARELVDTREDANEFGGYFVCNGIERVVRMLQIPRRNHPMAMTRSAYMKRGPLYTPYGVSMRCVRKDQSAITITLHYLADGGATLRFSLRRQEFFIPVVLVLRALRPTTDREIFDSVLGGGSHDSYLSDRVQLLLRDAKDFGVRERSACLEYLGVRFRSVLDMPETWTDKEAGQHLLDRYVLVHLTPQAHLPASSAAQEKFAMLSLMLRKLYLFVGGYVREDSADSFANQEILLAGHLYSIFLKEKLEELLVGVEQTMKREVRQGRAVVPGSLNVEQQQQSAAARGGAGVVASGSSSGPRTTVFDAYDASYFRRVVDRQPGIGRKIYYLLATGSLVSSTGLDLMQQSGFTVVADKINFMRFLTHFRSVHRGQFFTTMKTTAVRKLMPESWGFLCPVHTPDGSPCGLLNHLAAPAQPLAYPVVDSSGKLRRLLISLGITALETLGGVLPAHFLPVCLDGQVLGGADVDTIAQAVTVLRLLKGWSAGGNLPAEEADSEPLADAQNVVGDGSVLLGPHASDETTRQTLRDRRKLRNRLARLVSAAVRGVTNSLASTSTRSRTKGKNKHENGDGDGSDDDEPTAVADGATGHLRGSSDPEEWRRIARAVPPSLEVGFIPPATWLAAREASAREGTTAEELSGPFPGLFLFTGPARLVRPVIQLVPALGGKAVAEAVGPSGRMVELISPMEQLFMDIAATRDDFRDIAAVLDDEDDDETYDADGGANGSSTQTSMVMKKTKKTKKSKKQSRTTESKEGKEDSQEIERLRFRYTHMESSPMAMLSLAASLTPFSDMNQSPRNMYQCQMGKQTMGTPCHAMSVRSDSKLYRLQTPQAPIVQCQAQAEFGMDEYPAGTNAVVAVISYTGLDMEDAMIVNKSAYERGFAHASVYKSLVIDLVKDNKGGDAKRYTLYNPPDTRPRRRPADADGNSVTGVGTARERMVDRLDEDGLPIIGRLVREGDPLYCVHDSVTGKVRTVRHKDPEPAYISDVRIVGAENRTSGVGLQNATIKLRFNRNPVVGDKFSSRHGQKGVMSILWPQEDMPFSESGMSPDVIINPHAFPSRMTIGMLVESMAGKAGALHGRFQDSTPFRFGEDHRASDYFGEQLRAAGYNYYGNEPLYSGTSGTVLHADIFIGVVYYQRLRHMVSDKSQVRATGPVNNLTRQPVKGRKNHGGIRFGEMERDSLLAHGASFLLRDRLMNSSDRHTAVVCRMCGSLLSASTVPASWGQSAGSALLASRAAEETHASSAAAVPVPGIGGLWRCKSCNTGEGCVAVPLPFVFRYLASELAGMNIRLTFDIEKLR